jgi:hypothetical protein
MGFNKENKRFFHLTLDRKQSEKFKRIASGKIYAVFVREHLIPKYFESNPDGLESLTPFDGKERKVISVGIEPGQKDQIAAFAKSNSVPIGVVTNSMVASYEP